MLQLRDGTKCAFLVAKREPYAGAFGMKNHPWFPVTLPLNHALSVIQILKGLVLVTCEYVCVSQISKSHHSARLSEGSPGEPNTFETNVYRFSVFPLLDQYAADVRR